jgi:MoxR-like ATPase
VSENAPLTGSDLEAVKRLQDAHKRIRKEMAKVIVGQEKVIDQLLMAIFARGHAILEGVPGLAKTLMVSTLAKTMSLAFNRIQFTPDLMPTDITGTEVIQENRDTGHREFRFLRGPVFANVVLADEINRTPPKTQAALLEAMQERQVTAGGVRHGLPDPFFVLATQNPIEQEGTYPLPEAQQDRFMFKVFVGYPSWDEEFDIINSTTGERESKPETVLTADEIHGLQRTIRKIPAADHVVHYAMKLVRQTRVMDRTPDIPEFVRTYVSWGAGPRACQYLVLAGKAHAALNGKAYVGTDDIRAVAAPVLRHRVITNFNADSEGIKSDDIVERLVKITPDKDGGATSDKRLASAFR